MTRYRHYTDSTYRKYSLSCEQNDSLQLCLSDSVRASLSHLVKRETFPRSYQALSAWMHLMLTFLYFAACFSLFFFLLSPSWCLWGRHRKTWQGKIENNEDNAIYRELQSYILPTVFRCWCIFNIFNDYGCVLRRKRSEMKKKFIFVNFWGNFR